MVLGCGNLSGQILYVCDDNLKRYTLWWYLSKHFMCRDKLSWDELVPAQAVEEEMFWTAEHPLQLSFGPCDVQFQKLGSGLPKDQHNKYEQSMYNHMQNLNFHY